MSSCARMSRTASSPRASVKARSRSLTYKARDIMKKIAEATWLCGDPGMQFDTTIDKWHTSKNTAPYQCVQSLLGVHVPG